MCVSWSGGGFTSRRFIAYNICKVLVGQSPRYRSNAPATWVEHGTKLTCFRPSSLKGGSLGMHKLMACMSKRDDQVPRSALSGSA